MGMAGRRRAGEPDALALANQIPDRRIAFMPQASIPDKEQHNAAFITFVYYLHHFATHSSIQAKYIHSLRDFRTIIYTFA
jgi:hypothetical protein